MQRSEDEELDPAYRLYWDAWHDLRHDRPYFEGGVEGNIPFTALLGWAQHYGIGPVEFERVKVLIAALDAEYLKIMAEMRAARKREGEK